MPIRVLRRAHLALIALAVSTLTANAQVGEADKCVKVHQSACSDVSSGHYMGLHVQNTCSRDIMVFLRINYNNVHHPQAPKYSKTNQGEPWGDKSVVYHFMPRKTPPKPSFSGTIPCLKKVDYAYCAEYRPDSYREITGDYKAQTAKYAAMLPKSACYRESIKDPFETREGVRFHSLTGFAGTPARISRLDKFAGIFGGWNLRDHTKGEYHLSKLPK